VFINLSRKEIDKMLGLTTKFQDTKVYQEAKEEGIEEGKVEGKAEGMAELIVMFLTNRFGSLPSDLLSRLGAIADTEVLKTLFSEAASVPSISAFERLLQKY
jgi:predicted transposase YdaD